MIADTSDLDKIDIPDISWILVIEKEVEQPLATEFSSLIGFSQLFEH